MSKFMKIRRLEGFRAFGAFKPVKRGTRLWTRSWFSGTIVCSPGCRCMWCMFDEVQS